MLLTIINMTRLIISLCCVVLKASEQLLYDGVQVTERLRTFPTTQSQRKTHDTQVSDRLNTFLTLSQ